MINKITFFLLFISLVCLPSLFSQQEKVTVIAKSASIHSESTDQSSEIDKAKLGDVLTLYESWKGEKKWLYVIFRSKRWKSEVTGFIKSSLVVRGEIIPDELIEQATAEAEVKDPAQKEEGKEEKDDLPSLKDAFKHEEKMEEAEKAQIEEAKEVEKLKKVEQIEEKAAELEVPEPMREEKVSETKEIKTEVKEKPAEPEITKAEKETVQPEKEEVILAESEIPSIRDVSVPEAMTSKPRAYAVIMVREEIPALEIRKREIKDVAENEQEQIEVEPYIIKDEELETKTITKTEIVEEPAPEEKGPEEIKQEISEFPPVPAKPEHEETIKETEVIPTDEKAEEGVKPRKIEKALLEVEAQPEEKKPEKQEIPPIQQRKPPQEPIKPALASPKRINILTIGFGYGPSYGGLGASLQLNTKSGFSIHAGAGYYSAAYSYSEFEWLENQILFSAGIKYYLPFKSEKAHPFLDLQYGGLTVEAVQVPVGIYEGVVLHENLQKNLYGVSFLGGLELRFGRAGAKGAVGFSYNTTEWEYWDRDIFLTGEFAIVVYF